MMGLLMTLSRISLMNQLQRKRFKKLISSYASTNTWTRSKKEGSRTEKVPSSADSVNLIQSSPSATKSAR